MYLHHIETLFHELNLGLMTNERSVWNRITSSMIAAHVGIDCSSDGRKKKYYGNIFLIIFFLKL